MTRTTTATVTLTFTATSPADRRHVRRLYPRDCLPPGVVRVSKSAVERHDEETRVSYEIQPLRRGRIRLGPAVEHHTDLFGLYVREVERAPASAVVVWPQVTALDIPEILGRHIRGAGRGPASPGPDDAVVREYVPGDDPRRVHWPSSARRDALMVRAEEPDSAVATVVIVDDAVGGVDDAREAVMDYAASLAVGLVNRGHRVRLCPVGATPTDVSARGDGRRVLLDALADAPRLDALHAPAARRLTCEATRTPDLMRLPVVAILGALADHDLLPYTTLVTGTRKCIALVVGTEASSQVTCETLIASGWVATAVTI